MLSNVHCCKEKQNTVFYLFFKIEDLKVIFVIIFCS